MSIRSRLDAIVSSMVTVHPHEIPALLHSSSCFFFILSAYFVVLPLRDEGAISLGLSNLPGLFIGSLVLTLIAAPVSSFILSFPNLSKSKALVMIHRFFSLSLVVFFILWRESSAEILPSNSKESVSSSSQLKEDVKNGTVRASSANSVGWGNHSWFYISVRTGLFLWVALLNLVTISSTWTRIIDVMDNESGARLFGFIGAGATLGQLFGSLFATGMAWLGPCMHDFVFGSIFLAFIVRKTDPNQSKNDENTAATSKISSPETSTSSAQPQFWAILDGLRLILSSTYLLHVSLFLWLSAVISSFFYFQKVNVIAGIVASSIGRRRLFAQINSFIAVFILAGQLTLTGRILTVAGVCVAICSAPIVAFSNLIAVAVWPTFLVVAVCETLRKVVTYVVTRPGRELLFTVVSQEEKYRAKVCIDVIIQRLGDAAAAGLFKLLFSTLHGNISTVSLYALPVCLAWIVTAFYLGQRQTQLAKFRTVSTS
ncbi:uncharacterized protein LOC110819229 [Carica papaya]|uniref:uncharacterized protein LOC110819229 n=1 Tax=Carica papaya TaxID=3649 RepID=UPI000B8C85DA|nr:uncharacterized protein LOC110819229 [Carica papaya]